MSAPSRPALRAAVLGGGTAGHMVAAHLSKHFPEIELSFVFDPANATIGVGEGTTPAFALWLDQVSGGVSLQALEERCSVTLKRGVQYENWSARGERRFPHSFWGMAGYHISASLVIHELARHVRAERIAANAREVRDVGSHVEVVLDDRTLEVDYVLDARGFPPEEERRPHTLAGIPTNQALIRRGPPVEHVWGTRSIARPHGWVFVIPLRTHTSYGYVHHAGISSRGEVEADLEQLLREEGVAGSPEARVVPFPSFAHPRWVEGRILKMGNRAYFMEPLEATALHALLVQLKLAGAILKGVWMVQHEGRDVSVPTWANEAFYRFIRSVEHFVSWHYSVGGVYATPFWDHARGCYERLTEHRPRFDELLDKAQRALDGGYRYDGRGLGPEMAVRSGEDDFGPYPLKSLIETGLGLGLLRGRSRQEVFGGLTTIGAERYGEGLTPR